MIISQLELGPPVVEPVYNSSQTSGKKAGWVPLSSVKRTLEDQMTYKTSVLIMIDCLGLQILLRDVMSKWQSPETGVVKSIRDFDLTSRKANQSKILT